MWHNSKTQIVTKLKLWQTQIITQTQSQIVTKLKNSNFVKNTICDETQIVMKIKLWWNSKMQIVMKLKKTWIFTKPKQSNCDKTQMTKLKIWQNSNCDKTQNLNDKTEKLKVWQNSKFQT